MFIRKYWLPLSVFLVAICGVGLYLLATQPPKEPVVIYKAVEPIEKPSAEVLEGDTSQDGHVHADGTWHEEPHETPEQPTRQAPQLQEYAQYIPAHLLEAQRLAYVDMARSKAAFRAALPEDPFSAEFEKAVKSAVQQAVDLRPGIYDLPPGHLRRVEYAIARNLITEASGEAMRLHRRYDDPSSVARAKEILSWKAPYYALFTNTTQHEEEKNR